MSSLEKVLSSENYPAELVWFFDTFDVWVPSLYLGDPDKHPNSYRLDLFCFMYLLGVSPA